VFYPFKTKLWKTLNFTCPGKILISQSSFEHSQPQCIAKWCGSSYQLASKLRCCKIVFFSPFLAFLLFKMILVPPISSWTCLSSIFHPCKERFFMQLPCAKLNRVFSCKKPPVSILLLSLSHLSLSLSSNKKIYLRDSQVAQTEKFSHSSA